MVRAAQDGFAKGTNFADLKQIDASGGVESDRLATLDSSIWQDTAYFLTDPT
jgi:hypothetical protein